MKFQLTNIKNYGGSGGISEDQVRNIVNASVSTEVTTKINETKGELETHIDNSVNTKVNETKGELETLIGTSVNEAVNDVVTNTIETQVTNTINSDSVKQQISTAIENTVSENTVLSQKVTVEEKDEDGNTVEVEEKRLTDSALDKTYDNVNTIKRDESGEAIAPSTTGAADKIYIDPENNTLLVWDKTTQQYVNTADNGRVEDKDILSLFGN